MSEAEKLGFSYGDPSWANLGQGAPETGELPGEPERVARIDVDSATHEYAPVGGYFPLRQAVADLYNARYRRGMKSQYSAANVAISGGGRAGLSRLGASLGPIHLGHVLPDYTAYEELLHVFNGFVPIPIPVGREHGFRLTPDRLRDWVIGVGLGGLLISNPCNPTGHVYRGADLSAFVGLARELNFVLITDEFYSHYVYEGAEGETVSVAAFVEDVDRDPVVLVDGLTKNWRYPGWRLSWTLGPRRVIERVISAGSFLDGGPAHPIQRAAVAMVQQENADREAVAIQRVFKGKRDHMVRELRTMGFEVPSEPSGAFYCFACLDKLPEPLRAGSDLFRAALKHKVITVPGVFFDVDPGQRRGHIPSRLSGWTRLSFGPELASVERGLAGLRRTLRDAG